MLPPADPTMDEEGKERNAEEADGREDADVGGAVVAAWSASWMT